MKVTKLLGYHVSPCYTANLKNMLLLQNLMLEKLADKEVVVDEEEIFTQALGGKRFGHVLSYLLHPLLHCHYMAPNSTLN